MRKIVGVVVDVGVVVEAVPLSFLAMVVVVVVVDCCALEEFGLGVLLNGDDEGAVVWWLVDVPV